MSRMQEGILNTSQENVAEYLDRRIMKKQQKKGAATKKFAEGDLVITVGDVGKLDYKWKGPYRVFANVYELEDLRTKKKISDRDGFSLRAFICPEGVEPLAVAAQDEGEPVVREIVGHGL
jgi:acetone carboxylase gamma subunit